MRNKTRIQTSSFAFLRSEALKKWIVVLKIEEYKLITAGKSNLQEIIIVFHLLFRNSELKYIAFLRGNKKQNCEKVEITF